MIDRLRSLLRTVIICSVIFIAAYAVEIGVDVWIVDHEPEPASTTHIRYFVLPLGGLALGVILLLRRAVPAGRDALRIVEFRGPAGMALGRACRALAWTVAAIAVFQAAIWLQCQLFGFFLPP
jgi:hypothetical protein